MKKFLVHALNSVVGHEKVEIEASRDDEAARKYKKYLLKTTTLNPKYVADLKCNVRIKP
jgi:hypothetical protein